MGQQKNPLIDDPTATRGPRSHGNSSSRCIVQYHRREQYSLSPHHSTPLIICALVCGRTQDCCLRTFTRTVCQASLQVKFRKQLRICDSSLASLQSSAKCPALSSSRHWLLWQPCWPPRKLAPKKSTAASSGPSRRTTFSHRPPPASTARL